MIGNQLFAFLIKTGIQFFAVLVHFGLLFAYLLKKFLAVEESRWARIHIFLEMLIEILVDQVFYLFYV